MSDHVDPRAVYTDRFGWWSAVGSGVWLFFLVPAYAQAWEKRGSVAGWLGFVALVGFSGLYVYAFRWGRPRRQDRELWHRIQRPGVAIVGTLLGLGAVATLTLGGAGLSCSVFVSVAGITLLPWRWWLPLSVSLAAGSEALAHLVPGWQDAEGISFSLALASFAVWGLWQALRRSNDLAVAREESARLFVVSERARLARDLHDILGHSLTVIAVKAELADRLVETDPVRARSEVADIQKLARDALGDVRRTVHEARGLSLSGEVTRARAALEAAEIDADLPGTTDDVASDLRDLFAWTLREAVTNVVRHSGATHCTVTLERDRITVTDDGAGMPADQDQAIGHGRGLAGLRERAAAAGAQVRVVSPPRGGFTITVIGIPDPACPPAADPTQQPTRIPAEAEPLR